MEVERAARAGSRAAGSGPRASAAAPIWLFCSSSSRAPPAPPPPRTVRCRPRGASSRWRRRCGARPLAPTQRRPRTAPASGLVRPCPGDVGVGRSRLLARLRPRRRRTAPAGGPGGGGAATAPPRERRLPRHRARAPPRALAELRQSAASRPSVVRRLGRRRRSSASLGFLERSPSASRRARAQPATSRSSDLRSDDPSARALEVRVALRVARRRLRRLRLGAPSAVTLAAARSPASRPPSRAAALTAAAGEVGGTR